MTRYAFDLPEDQVDAIIEETQKVEKEFEAMLKKYHKSDRVLAQAITDEELDDFLCRAADRGEEAMGQFQRAIKVMQNGRVQILQEKDPEKLLELKRTLKEIAHTLSSMSVVVYHCVSIGKECFDEEFPQYVKEKKGGDQLDGMVFKVNPGEELHALLKQLMG